MRQNQESEEVHAELVAAQEALSHGRYEEAESHLNAAAHAGAPPKKISDLGRAVKSVRAQHDQRVQKSVWIGFFLGILIYLFVSVRQPLDWGMSVWALLAFLVTPGLVGTLVGRRHAGERSPVSAFKDGLKAGAWAMACYAAINLAVVGARLQKEGGMGGEYLAGCLVLLVFSLLAGLVAGAVSALMSRGGTRRIPT